MIKSTQSISAQTINLEEDTIDVDDNMGLQPDKIDSEKNILVVKGSIPGAKNSTVIIEK